MKNSSKKFFGKNNKEYKKNSDFGYYSKNTNRSEKNEKFLKNSTKNNNLENFNKNNNTFSSLKRRKPIFKSNTEFSNKNHNNHQDFTTKRNFDDWIWGKHSVYETLTSERAINRIWCTSEIFSSDKFYILLKDLKSKGVLIEEVSWNRLTQLTCGSSHQGVALQLASSKTISLEQLIDSSKNNCANPIILALDGITDPHNLGAIIRSAEAFDCKGIIVPQRRSAGLTGTVAKVAAGALEHIPVSRVVNLNRAIDELKKKGFLIIGLSGEGQVPISEFKEKAPFLVIVGAENKGISLLVQKKCDYLLKIPLKGKTSSLNASVAAAISLCYISNN